MEYYIKSLEIKESEDKFILNLYSKINTKNGIGQIHRSLGETNLAIELFSESLEICEINLVMDHPLRAGTLSRIAGINCNLGDYDEALNNNL